MELSCQDEFFRLEHCSIPVLPVQIFEGILLVVLFGVFITMLLTLERFYRIKRPLPNVILVTWMIAHVPLAATRGVLSLLNIHSEHSIWANLIVNGAAASATVLIIFFMYLELKIIIKGSLQTKDSSLTGPKWTMALIAVTQALVFLTLPLILRAFESNEPLLYFGFWVPATLANFVSIAYFCVLGLTILKKLRRSSLPAAKRAARKLLIFLVLCAALATVSGASGLVALLWRDLGWILLRVCWFSVALFDFLMFHFLTRPSKHTVSSSKDISISKKTSASS